MSLPTLNLCHAWLRQRPPAGTSSDMQGMEHLMDDDGSAHASDNPERPIPQPFTIALEHQRIERERERERIEPEPEPECRGDMNPSRPGQLTAARLFEMLPQTERNMFGLWTLGQQDLMTVATVRKGDAVLVPFDAFSWSLLATAYRENRMPLDYETTRQTFVDSEASGIGAPTQELWDGRTELVTERERLDVDTCIFREQALTTLQELLRTSTANSVVVPQTDAESTSPGGEILRNAG